MLNTESTPNFPAGENKAYFLSCCIMFLWILRILLNIHTLNFHPVVRLWTEVFDCPVLHAALQLTSQMLVVGVERAGSRDSSPVSKAWLITAVLNELSLIIIVLINQSLLTTVHDDQSLLTIVPNDQSMISTVPNNQLMISTVQKQPINDHYCPQRSSNDLYCSQQPINDLYCSHV